MKLLNTKLETIFSPVRGSTVFDTGDGSTVLVGRIRTVELLAGLFYWMEPCQLIKDG